MYSSKYDEVGVSLLPKESYTAKGYQYSALLDHLLIASVVSLFSSSGNALSNVPNLTESMESLRDYVDCTAGSLAIKSLKNEESTIAYIRFPSQIEPKENRTQIFSPSASQAGKCTEWRRPVRITGRERRGTH